MVLLAQVKHLSINIKQALPHIMLPIGTEDASIYPTITGIIDKRASLTAGYVAYILGICEKQLYIVQSIIWDDNDTGVQYNYPLRSMCG